MADSYVPPQAVRDNAKRGLDLRAKHNRGGTEVGVARARDLSNGRGVSLDTIRRMVSYFARHEVDKKGEGWGVDSAGYIAWLLWGGDAGKAWANKINNEAKTKDKTAMTDFANSYALIVKQEKQDDGTLKVFGKATDDSLDIDSQICDPTWLASAMPDWFESGGNIREQHSNIAAGVATDYERKGAEHFITALVVDPVSVKKVETGVLKGFSIGIRSPRIIRDEKAANGRIIDGQIVEVSLVDRPANPNAKLMLAKAAENGELMSIEQTNIPTPDQVFANKSDNPLDAIVETVEAVAAKVEDAVAEVVADVAAVAHEVETVVADAEQVAADAAPVVEAVEGTAAQVEATASDVADLLNGAKSLLATLNKFDQAKYDAAMGAISDLIIVEAGEMAQGSDERDSIKELLRAAKHLAEWYEGEAENGEVPGVMVSEDGDLYAAADDLAMAAKGTDACDCGDKSCDKCMDKATEKAVKFDVNNIDAIVEKAVASAKTAVASEIEILKADIVAAEQKAATLEAELANALTKTAAGGPVRAGKPVDETKRNELLAKAAHYATLAKTTADVTLRKGYAELAEDFDKKANKL